MMLPSILFVASTVVANPLLRGSLQSRAACGENADLICFGKDGGEAQDLNEDDIAYAAAYLRYLGENADGLDAMWTMPSAVDCEEWTLPIPAGGSVLALAKHINPRIKSSVLYTDMADTIDGGEDGSVEESLLNQCGEGGGMVGVITDSDNDAYNTDEYKATKAKPEGIIIKLVRDPLYED